jgi:hypothetical protein
VVQWDYAGDPGSPPDVRLARLPVPGGWLLKEIHSEMPVSMSLLFLADADHTWGS